MPWLFLIIAGCFDVMWITCMKYSEGFTKLWPSVTTCVGALMSFVCLSQAVKVLPVSTTYITIVGIGGVGTALVGILLFNETFTPVRILCFMLIIIGVVGLKLQS